MTNKDIYYTLMGFVLMLLCGFLAYEWYNYRLGVIIILAIAANNILTSKD